MRSIKIFDEDKVIYEGNLSVNTVIFRGKVDKNPYVYSDGKVIRFGIIISNGKDPLTNKWRKPTTVQCTAFGDLAEKIARRYRSKDEIWIVGRYKTSWANGKMYTNFVVQKVINMKTEDYIDDGEATALLGDEDFIF